MSYSSRANVQIRKILVGRGNTAVSSAYTGVRGEVTMDTDLKTLRIHDGVQQGGYIMAGQGWVEEYVANAALGNIDLTGFATTANLNSLSANVGAYQVWANATFGTSSYGDSNVAAYLVANPQGSTYSNANVAAYLVANPQPGTYSNSNVETYLGANVGAYQVWANAHFGTSTYSNSNVAAYLVANPQTGTFSNSNVAAYLVNFPQSGTYSNTNVQAYMGSFYTYANTTYSTWANAAAAHSEINGLRANITAANTAIVTANADMKIYVDAVTTAWTANAASQQTQINNFNANLGAYQIYANGNATTQATAINTLNANTGAYQTWANLTFSTVANATSQQIQIDNLTSNAATQAVSINNINANTGAYQTWANLTFSTVANAASQQTQIDNFNANLGAYQTYANANAATQATSINNINANTGAFQTYANTTFSTVANATSQQLQINSLQANIAAANTLIYSNANVAAYLTTATINTSGNITGGNITIANNAVILGNLRVSGTTTTVNTATLNVTDLYITVANNATQPSDANGAGLRVAGALANITYVYPGDYWEFNKPIHANLTTGNIVFGDGTYQTTSWYANAASQQIQIDNIDANLGTATTNIANIDANVGAYQTWANANLGSLTNNVTNLDANVGAYQVWANANLGSLTNNVTNLDANVGAFQTYANSTFVTGTPWTSAGYLTAETDTLDSVTTRGNTTTNDITVGNVTTGNIVNGSHSWNFNTNGELIIENTIRTQAGQYLFIGSDTSTEMSWSNSVQAPNTGVYAGLGSDGSGTSINIANTDSLGNWVSKAWQFDMTGNLTVPGDIIPNVDNLHDLGSATNRFRHLYVGPGTIYVGNAAISTTATGNLLIPGLTRAVASSAYVEEVQDTGDQTYSFGTVPTVIDGAQWQQLTSGRNFSSFTPAEYSVDQLDGEGFIDGISIDSQGSGYAGEVVGYANQSMWATEAADPINNFNPSDWIQIPFRVQTRAGESEYEFNFSGEGGGTSSGETPPEDPAEGALWYDQVSGRLFVWYDETWVDASIGGINSGTSANTGNITFDDVTIRGTTGTMVFQGNIDRSDLAWTITNSNEGGFDVSSLLAPMGDDQHVGEIIFSGSDGGGALVYVGNIGTPFDNAFNLTAQGTNANVKISTVNGDWQWTFDNTGNLVIPYNYLTLDSGYNTGTAGFVAPTGGVSLGSTMLYNSGNIASQILQNREGSGGTVQISAYQDNSNPAATWTFDNTGNLTVPADSTVKSASGDLNLYATGNVNIESKGHTFIFDTDTVGRFIMPPSGVIAGRASVDGEYDSNGLNIFVGNITTEVGSNWRFDATGNLTLPTAGNINFANGVNILSTIVAGSTYSNVNVAAYLVANPQSGTYSNANVAAYLVANPQESTYSNSNVASYLAAQGIAAQIQSDWNQATTGNVAYIKNKPDLSVYSTVANAALQATWLANLEANAATQATSINTLNANIGAYQTWANSTFATTSALSGYATTTQFNTLNANVGAYQIYANANLGTATTNISTLQANVGAYQIWSNANASTQATSINTINANIGAYQVWANATFTTYSNTNVAAYLVQNPQTGTYSNANVIANLQNLTTNITTTGNISGNTAGFSIGYLDIPQTATNSAYVLALADRGKHIYSTTASNQNVYIPTNANAAFPVGSAVNFVLQGTGNIIITANSGVTLFLAGNSTSGANSRTLSSYGVATLQKVATNTWFGVGVGLA